MGAHVSVCLSPLLRLYCSALLTPSPSPFLLLHLEAQMWTITLSSICFLYVKCPQVCEDATIPMSWLHPACVLQSSSRRAGGRVTCISCHRPAALRHALFLCRALLFLTFELKKNQKTKQKAWGEQEERDWLGPELPHHRSQTPCWGLRTRQWLRLFPSENLFQVFLLFLYF